jgi:integral membrane sensor domain MASE1
MQGDTANVRSYRAGLAAVLTAGYVASALLSVLVGRFGGPIASLWTANGFLAGAFILLPRRWRIGVAATCVTAEAAISLATGDGLARAALYPLVNLLEAALAGWLAIRFCGAVAGAVVNATLQGQPLLDGWMAWAAPGGLGMAIVLPAVLLAVRAGQYKEFDRSRLETVAILAGLGALVAAVFLERDLPLHFAIFPALTVVAVRLGPPGAAAAGLLAAMIALPLTMLDQGAAALAPGLGAAGRVRLTELVVAAALITTLVTAVAVGEQTRLRRLMLGRDRAARAARLRARRAERAAAEAQGAPTRPRGRIATLV